MSTQRRQENDDRRKIERVTSPPLRTHLNLIKWCLLFITVFFAGAAVYNFFSITSVTEFTLGAFLGVVFIIMAAVVWSYYRAILLYLENESSSNLDRAMERQTIFWITGSFFAVFYTAIHFIFH